MKTITLSLFLMVCSGCNIIKTDRPEKKSSTEELVSITVSKQDESYSTKAQWIKFDPDTSSEATVLSAPCVSGRPNEWTTIRVVEVPQNYCSTTQIMVDGEMIEVPNGYGATLSIYIIPRGNTVDAKGVFSVEKLGEHFDVPFSGNFKLDETTTIYHRTEICGPNAHKNSVLEMKPSLEKLF